METNITKGERFVSNDNQIVSMPSQCKITNRVSGWNPEEAKANAKLIASAPELLNTLISVLNIMNDSEGVAGYHINGDIALWDEFEEIKQAEQAIKKATE